VIPVIDETHSPELRSWVDSANAPTTDFPVQNLALGVFRANDGRARPSVAIGAQILDLTAAVNLKLLDAAEAQLVEACASDGALNLLLEAGPKQMRSLRSALSLLLRDDSAQGKTAREHAATLLVPSADAEPLLPVRIGDYSDFYTSIHHASNVGRMFRPDNALLPNYKWVPIASADTHIAGLWLVNDWSARDIQTWEYQPLGPFLAKSFATTISPWLVTLDALAPFRVPLAERGPDDPAPLAYLDDASDRSHGGFAIELSVVVVRVRIREERRAPFLVSTVRYESSVFWTPAQLVAHHTSNGCNLRPGDLLATGTVSGPTPESRGCLLERTWRGCEPLSLPSGEARRLLEDGDEVSMRGRCERPGFRPIGFGECRGIVSG